MKHIIVKATFKGQNNSLGYKTGSDYKLKISQLGSGAVDIHDIGRTSGFCKYDGMHNFFKNWVNVTDITESELKKNKSDVKSFVDLCDMLVQENKSSTQFMLSMKKATAFYNEEFSVEKVMDYFKNWSITKKPNLGLISLTNRNEKKSRISIDTSTNNFGYCFISDNHSNDDNNWYPIPKNMSEFISDCLRQEDFEMIFTEKAIKKIYR